MRLPKTLLVSFQTEFGPYEKELSQSYQDVRNEASLLSHPGQREENQLQAEMRFERPSRRNILTKLTSTINDNQVREEQAREEERRLSIRQRSLHNKKMQFLNNLSRYDHQKTYKQIRKSCVPGTSTWILEHPEFVAWKDQASEVLWCSGRCKYAVIISHMQRLPRMTHSGIRQIGFKVDSCENLLSTCLC